MLVGAGRCGPGGWDHAGAVEVADAVVLLELKDGDAAVEGFGDEGFGLGGWWCSGAADQGFGHDAALDFAD